MSAETFDARWLALREEADHRSRDAGLAGRLADWWRASEAASVLDLGSGTGSNLRWLAPRLPGHQSWTLLDHDAELLARSATPDGIAVTIRSVVGDLARDGLAHVAGADLVTASALLDLVSASWVDALADVCAASASAAYFALTYDGRTEWAARSPDPVDELVRDAVNEHQLGDKGLGSALGPGAAAHAETAFVRRGFETRVADAAWRLGRDDAALARELIRGWARVATEAHPERADDVDAWSQRRRVDVALGHAEVLVGHVDLLALPPSRPPA